MNKYRIRIWLKLQALQLLNKELLSNKLCNNKLKLLFKQLKLQHWLLNKKLKHKQQVMMEEVGGLEHGIKLKISEMILLQ